MLTPAREDTKTLPRRRSRLLFLAALVFAAAAIALWAFGALGNRRSGRETEASALVEARAFDQALPILDRWVSDEPNSAAARYWRGRTLIGLERPQEGLAELEKARRLGYPEPPLEKLVGIVMAKSGRHAQAEPMLLRDLDRNPRPDADRDEALATVLIELYRFGPALLALDRWAAAAPDDTRPLLLKAELLQRTEAGADQVADVYRAALSRDPNDGTARLGLADALREQGLFPQALTEYHAYLAAHPNDARALTGAGLAALSDGQEEAAQTLLDQALELDPNQIEALDGRAVIAMRRGQHEQALSALDRALAIDSIQPEIHYRRGLALESLGRTTDAQAARAESDRLRREAAELNDVRRQLLRSPRDTDLQLRLARWLLEHQRDEEGLLWAQRALGDPRGRAAAARLLVEHHQRRGDSARANYYRALAGPDSQE